MKKVSPKKKPDGLRREYDLSQLKGGMRGKYYRQATSGTNLVLIEPDLTELFPDGESVNRALRLLADTAGAAARLSTRRKTPNKAIAADARKSRARVIAAVHPPPLAARADASSPPDPSPLPRRPPSLAPALPGRYFPANSRR